MNPSTTAGSVKLLLAWAIFQSGLASYGQITRTQIINNATPFTTFNWSASSCNLWSGTPCGGRNVFAATPANSTSLGWVVSGLNTSMPYCWGGFSSQTQHNTAMATCKSAGDICSAGVVGGNCSAQGSSGAGLSCASGLDCSGLVSRAWGLSSHQGTGLLPGISTAISFSQLQSGDIVNNLGVHTRLISAYNTNGSATVVEASGTDWKTSFRTYSAINQTGYIALCYNNVQGGCGGGCTPPANNVCSTGVPTIAVGTSCSYTSGDIYCASESYTASGCPSGLIQDVWYRFTVTSSGSHTVRVDPSSSMDAVVELRQSSCTGTVLGCIDAGGGPGAVENLILLLSNGTYYVRVYDYNNAGNTTPPATTTFDICVIGPGGGTCPDPTISSLTFDPPNPTAGLDVDFDIVIDNVGTASTVAADDPRIEYWVNGVYTGFDDDETTVLGPGDSNAESLTNYVFSAPGTYTVCAILDPYPNECPTNNNTICQQITVQPGSVSCTSPQLTPPSVTHSPAAFSTTPGADDVIVDVQPSCEYTITGSCLSAGWFTLNGPSSGTANGAGQFFINYSLAANTTTTPLSCSLNINGAIFTVSQDGCTYEINDPPAIVPCSGGSGTFEVETYSPCSWSIVQSNCGWVSLSQTSGTNDVDIDYTVTQTNPSATARTCTLTLTGGETYTITQQGSAAPNQPGLISGDNSVCSGTTENYSISPVSGATSYSWFYTGIGTPSGSGTSVTLTPTTSGVLSVTANGDCANSTPRTLSITVTTAPFATITYNGSPYCSNGGTASVTHTGTAGGTYSATPAGLVLNGSTGLITIATSAPGTYTVTYTVAASGACAQFQTTTSLVVVPSTTWYADADGDGAGDPLVTQIACTQPSGYVGSSNDQCPGDPDKIAPGICGCGVADTDDDGDGTPNCTDGCPNDPNKVSPGICGCGVADTDTDGDATADCVDGCPNDPLKTAPGVCGCGTPDTDSDGDGIPNCIDPCDNNTDGQPCSTGTPCVSGETWQDCVCQGGTIADSDSDGICDADDNCPNDSNPSQADSDGDLLGDACDPCDNSTDGQPCSSGTPCITGETFLNCLCQGGVTEDADADGVCDPDDNCPNTANASQDDVDTDGLGNACDPCDNTTDGQPCVSGIPCMTGETFLNCQCQGGTTTGDSDGDGVCDADDNCPDDPNPLQADTDLDGLGNECDPCDNTTNGQPCSNGTLCVVGETYLNCVCQGGTLADADLDGVCDAIDNCFNDANPLQEDSDGDTIGDACDSCDNNTDGQSCSTGTACTTGETWLNCVCQGGTAADIDLDGVCDGADNCLNNSNPLQEDLDGDGIGNVCDLCDNNTDGQSCSTGDPCVTGETWSNCVCQGGSPAVDSDSDGLCDAIDPCVTLANVEPGDACSDGNACTISDQINASCTCVGTLVGDADGDGLCDLIDPCPTLANIEPGDSCDDGNVLTVGETWDVNCTCSGGTAVDCEDTPGGTALPGTACDDGNPNTGNDTWLSTCECEGDTSTWVTEVQTSTWFTIHPNPSNGTFQVTPAGSGASAIDIRVFDGLGQLVGAPVILTGSQPRRLDLHEKANGIYFLRATRGSESQVLELIIQR